MIDHDNTSLQKWIHRAAQARIPAVPIAWTSTPLRITDIYEAMEGNCSPELAMWFKNSRAAIAAHPDCMVRWDCCAPEQSKYLAAKREPFGERWRELTIHDCRLFDCTVPDDGGCTVLHLRPWEEPQRVDGWPVEFRVYVSAGKVLGVSNYYPQVRLHKGFQARAVEAADYAHEILAVAGCPQNCSLDFILTQRCMRFLEGGPPHRPDGGAHPCCFEGREISGIALEVM